MLNTFKIYNQLKENMEPAAAEAIVESLTSVFEELQNSVTKTEFNELRDIVRQQGENINLLTARVDDLTVRMAQLTSNISRLEEKVENLVGEMKNFKEQLGGLAHTVGYRLEDESYIKLPVILERDHSVVVKGRLKRGWLELKKNKYIEINIWGQGEHFGRPVEIIGEAKSQLKKRDVDRFTENLDIIRPHFDRDIYPVCVTYQTSPAVLKYSKDKGMNVFFSYELDQ
jgi:predicted RNase H-like nuclease (RuvC/YqgF family)